MAETADILDFVESRFGSTERAQAWFEGEPLPRFGEATAKQLVKAGRGREVQEFIAAVDAGVHC